MKLIQSQGKAKTVMELTSNLIKKKLKESEINKELTSLRNKVRDSSKIKANKPKESSQEKPDYQAPRTYEHLLLMGPMRELFLGTGPMICITKSSKCMTVRSGRPLTPRRLDIRGRLCTIKGNEREE
jgi:hypothetical protein